MLGILARGPTVVRRRRVAEMRDRATPHMHWDPISDAWPMPASTRRLVVRVGARSPTARPVCILAA
jgi:hypothetical protein